MAPSTTERLAPRRSARDTRAAIAEVALEEFTGHGYDGTALQRIADRLGLTKAALYYHFKSKDDLLLGVLAPLLADIDELLASIADRPAPGDREDGIEGYLDFLLEHRRLLSYLSRDAAALARPAVAGRMRAYDAAISAGIAGADLTAADQITVSFAVAGMQGAISAHASVPAQDLRAPIRAAVDAVLATIAPQA